MFHFPGRRPGEKVLSVIRKHFIVYTKILLVFLLLILLPVIIFFSIWLTYYPAGDYPDLYITAVLFGGLYLLYGMLFSCIAWINEAFDLFVVSNERLVDITQVNFFKRTVASTPLEQIQDTTSNVDGFLPTLLNYGDVEVQTAAGDASSFFIDRVPDSPSVARNILNWAHERRNTGNVESESEEEEEGEEEE